MAYENLDGIFSYPAAADYSVTGQYQFAQVNTSGLAALVAAAGVIPDGLLHNLPKAAEPARLVQKQGVVVKAKVGAGGVTQGSLCTLDNTGKITNVTTVGYAKIGKALVAGAAGDVIPFLYMGFMGNY